MHASILQNNLDTLLLGVPFVLMMLVGIFRLDELMVTPRQKTVTHPRPLNGLDAEGNLILSDPDGTCWQTPQVRQAR
jgi:hypothetical protein